MTKRRKNSALYRADVTPGGRGIYQYTISGPAGPMVTGKYRGTKDAMEKHLAKTLRRLNEDKQTAFHINHVKEGERARA